MKQQLAFLKIVENKLKGALGNSKSFSESGVKFSAAVTFALPAASSSPWLTDCALWALGEPVKCVRSESLDEENFDELNDSREIELLKIRFMTRDILMEWAFSAPEWKKEVAYYPGTTVEIAITSLPPI